EHVLARAPLPSREHQQDQGDRPLVQPELHPSDEGREVDGNPREPDADAPAPGVPEAVTQTTVDSPQSTVEELPLNIERWGLETVPAELALVPVPAPAPPALSGVEGASIST